MMYFSKSPLIKFERKLINNKHAKSCSRSVSKMKVYVLASIFVLGSVSMIIITETELSATTFFIAYSIVAPVCIGILTSVSALRMFRLCKNESLKPPKGLKIATRGVLVFGILTTLAPFLFPLGIYAFQAVARPNRSPMKAHKYTPPSTDKVELSFPVVPLGEIVTDTKTFDSLEVNNEDSRREYCSWLLTKAGLRPVVSDRGDVVAMKHGSVQDFIVVGAHFDKVDGPSKGILDNMLGCILVGNIAKALKDMDTKFTYLFVFYGDEETGRRIPSPTSALKFEGFPIPTYVIEIDYVGDKRAPRLLGRFLSAAVAFQECGIKITTYQHPNPLTIHTERDNIENVDFEKAYLAYLTSIWMIEQIEAGEGLVPPETVYFRDKHKPILGLWKKPN